MHEHHMAEGVGPLDGQDREVLHFLYFGQEGDEVHEIHFDHEWNERKIYRCPLLDLGPVRLEQLPLLRLPIELKFSLRCLRLSVQS